MKLEELKALAELLEPGNFRLVLDIPEVIEEELRARITAIRTAGYATMIQKGAFGFELVVTEKRPNGDSGSTRDQAPSS